MKHRLVHLLQKFVANPPTRAALAVGLLPPPYALLEVTGRKTGKPRTVPVGAAVDGDTVWIVSEHGYKSGYVRNIQHDPRVRLKLRRGLRTRWRSGTAHLLPDDDPRERQRAISSGKLSVRLNALAVRSFGTDLLTVRIDLDQEAGRTSSPA
jgi:deazaflavin-dependent oxidoreductase (nitroreductase family)